MWCCTMASNSVHSGYVIPVGSHVKFYMHALMRSESTFMIIVGFSRMKGVNQFKFAFPPSLFIPAHLGLVVFT